VSTGTNDLAFVEGLSRAAANAGQANDRTNGKTYDRLCEFHVFLTMRTTVCGEDSIWIYGSNAPL